MFVINSLFMTRCSMKHKALNEVKTSCFDGMSPSSPCLLDGSELITFWTWHKPFQPLARHGSTNGGFRNSPQLMATLWPFLMK